MGKDKYPEGPTRKRWFERGREYERGRLDEAAEEDKELSPIERIVEAEVENIIKRNKRSREL